MIFFAGVLREIVNTVRRLGSLVASALNSRNDDNNLRQVVHTHAPLCRVPLFSCSGVKEPSLNHKPPAVVFHDSLGLGLHTVAAVRHSLPHSVVM